MTTSPVIHETIPSLMRVLTYFADSPEKFGVFDVFEFLLFSVLMPSEVARILKGDCA